MSLSLPQSERKADHPLSLIRALWRHRELLWQFTVRNLELRHKGSHLGMVWSVLNPLLMLSLYVFIFGYIFGGQFNGLPGETKIDYALALFLGLTVFQLVAEVIAISPTVIIANPNFVKKVVFPLEVLPAALVGSSIFHMLISLCLVLLGVVFVGPGLNAKVVWLPLILLPLVPLSLGISWILGAVGVFLRDIGQVVGFATMVLLYASAIFFPIEVIPHPAWTFLRFNPLLLAIDLARNAVMWEHPVRMAYLVYLWITSVFTCVFGFWVFRKMSPAFADVL